ncbi:MAG: Hsp20/alpha crystallin family protein [Alicyclobacillaceae bacterium]|nr:Hsp20/alpha crystallin family protein [Alicyclobacillaceae bacterium]
MASKKDGSSTGPNNSYNPFDMLRNMGDMQNLRGILGDDFFKNIPFPQMQSNPGEQNQDGDQTYPLVDLYDRGHELVAVVEVPGAAGASDISIRVGSQHLNIRGRAADFGGRDDRLIFAERHHGTYERDIELPVRVVVDKVKATYRQGILIVRLQKYLSSSDPDDNYIPITFEE